MKTKIPNVNKLTKTSENSSFGNISTTKSLCFKTVNGPKITETRCMGLSSEEKSVG